MGKEVKAVKYEGMDKLSFGCEICAIYIPK